MDEAGESGLEEERRLAYVGLTRAREKAFISHADNRRMYGQTQNALPSRFFEELPEEHVQFPSSINKAYSMDMIEPAWSKSSSFYRDDDFVSPKEEKSTFYFGNKSKWSREDLNQQEDDFYPFAVTSVSKSQKSKRIGKRVHHELFGDGTVVKDMGDALAVSFDKVGLKKVKSAFLEELFS